MRLLILAALLTLTACGADGPPLTPSPEPAIGISGELAVGMTTRIN